MSWQAMAIVQDRKFKSLTDKALMMQLASYHHNDGGGVYPAVGTLADDIQSHERTVQRKLANFVEEGLLILECEADPGARRPRIYQIDFDALEALPLTESAKRQRQRRHDSQSKPARQSDEGAARGHPSEGEQRELDIGGVAQGHPRGGTKPPYPLVHPFSRSPSGDLGAPSRGSADPPLTLKARLFGQCLEWLAKHTGKQPDQLRSMIGRWCRDHGDGRVLEVFEQAERYSPLEPIAWIESTLYGANSKGPSDTARAVAGIRGFEIDEPEHEPPSPTAEAIAGIRAAFRNHDLERDDGEAHSDH